MIFFQLPALSCSSVSDEISFQPAAYIPYVVCIHRPYIYMLEIKFEQYIRLLSCCGSTTARGSSGSSSSKGAAAARAGTGSSSRGSSSRTSIKQRRTNDISRKASLPLERSSHSVCVHAIVSIKFITMDSRG